MYTLVLSGRCFLSTYLARAHFCPVCVALPTPQAGLKCAHGAVLAEYWLPDVPNVCKAFNIAPVHRYSLDGLRHVYLF